MANSAVSTDQRIGIITTFYEKGMRVEDLDPDTSDWVRQGLKALEEGRVFTESDLTRIDELQNTSNPERI